MRAIIITTKCFVRYYPAPPAPYQPWPGSAFKSFAVLVAPADLDDQTILQSQHPQLLGNGGNFDGLRGYLDLSQQQPLPPGKGQDSVQEHFATCLGAA